MMILHDYDSPFLRANYAFKRGLRLLLYGIAKYFGLKPTFLEPIYNEVREYADTIIKLDKLIGVTPIMGIRDVVQDQYPNILEELGKYGVDLRTHTHIGEPPDPNRVRTYEPSDGLENVSHNVWHYDTDYASNKNPTLNKGDIPIWHVDYPHFIKHYIDFLYARAVGGLK